MTRIFALFLSISLLSPLASGKALSRAQLSLKLGAWSEQVRSIPVSEPEDVFEKDLFLEWIYRLKFATQAKYKESDKSLIWILEDLLEVENSVENRPQSRFAPFLESLLISIKEDREPVEPLFDYIKEYTEYGGILNPATPEEFAETREYRSPGLTEAASPQESDVAAESLEIRELAKPVNPELTPKATVPDSTKGDTSVTSDKVIQSNEPTAEPVPDTVELSEIL